jgi:hypothetical protein
MHTAERLAAVRWRVATYAATVRTRVPAWVPIVLALTVGVAAGSVATLAAQGARGVCAREDSPACVWIAPVQGNNAGQITVNP